MKQYRMFWTGGLDTSFRLTQLAQREDAEIFPVYVIFPWRPSTEFEMKRHVEFMDWLKASGRIRAVIHPVEYLTANREVPVLSDVAAAIRSVAARYQPFGEYDHLSSYAATHPGVELCIPWNPAGREIPIIKIIDKALGGLVLDEEGIGWVKDPENRDPEVMKALGNFSFPLAKIRNWDYKPILESQGFDFREFISRTWSCYAPFHGDRCGVCRSCRGKLMHVPYMKEYYSKASQRRFKVWEQLGETGEPVVNGMFYTGTQSQRELVMAARGVLLVRQEQMYRQALEAFKASGNEYGVRTAADELKRIAVKRQKYMDMLEAVS